MKVESLIDFDELDFELELGNDSEELNDDLNIRFNSLSNPYLEWAENNVSLLYSSTQPQLVFKFYLEFKDSVSFNGVESFKEHFLECQSLCIYYLNKVLTRHLKEVLRKEEIQKELDSYLKVNTRIFDSHYISLEQYQEELKRKHLIIKETLDSLNLKDYAFNWMYSKHPDIFINLDNPRYSNHNFNKLLKSAIKWDLKQNKQGLLKDSLIPDLRNIYISVFKTFREYSIQQNRISLLDSKKNKHSPLKSTAISPCGASKSDYNRVATNATGTTVISKTLKLSLPVGRKTAGFESEHSVSDLPYDDKLRDTGLVKILVKRRAMNRP